jgi:hypothetical protein
VAAKSPRLVVSAFIVWSWARQDAPAIVSHAILVVQGAHRRPDGLQETMNFTSSFRGAASLVADAALRHRTDSSRLEWHS